MSTHAVSEAPAQTLPAIEISLARRLWWCVQRELWENRSLYVAPLSVAALILAGFAVRLAYLPEKLRAAALVSPGFWFGLVLCAAFLFAAVRLRRYHEPA